MAATTSSVAAGQSATASDINNIKSRIKTELARRSHTTSVSSYAGTAYDYSTTPATGGSILVEHQTKIIDPLNAIKATGVTKATSGLAITILALLTRLISNEGTAMKASTADCTTACAGLCQTGCWDACKGCTASCASNCSGGCTNCTGSCSGGCAGCMGTCKGSCTARCQSENYTI